MTQLEPGAEESWFQQGTPPPWTGLTSWALIAMLRRCAVRLEVGTHRIVVNEILALPPSLVDDYSESVIILTTEGVVVEIPEHLLGFSRRLVVPGDVFLIEVKPVAPVPVYMASCRRADAT